MRRYPAVWLAANVVCVIACATAAAKTRRRLADLPPLFAPFDPAAYAPRLPLPAGWHALKVHQSPDRRWLCRHLPKGALSEADRTYNCIFDRNVIAAWDGDERDGDDAHVEIRAQPTRPRDKTRGWTETLGDMLRFFRSSAPGSFEPSCREWRGPQGRVAECYGPRSLDDVFQLFWMLWRIEERPGWILEADALLFSEGPSNDLLEEVRATFIDGPLGPPPAAEDPKRRR